MAASSNPRNTRHMMKVSCPGGHIAQFDKRRICSEKSDVYRDDQSGKKLNRLFLKCNQCGKELVVSVDCEGYR